MNGNRRQFFTTKTTVPILYHTNFYLKRCITAHRFLGVATHYCRLAVTVFCLTEVQFTFQNIQDAGARGLDVVAFEAKQSDESILSKLIQARRKGIRYNYRGLQRKMLLKANVLTF